MFKIIYLPTTETVPLSYPGTSYEVLKAVIENPDWTFIRNYYRNTIEVVHLQSNTLGILPKHLFEILDV
jgi:hypothetical protein